MEEIEPGDIARDNLIFDNEGVFNWRQKVADFEEDAVVPDCYVLRQKLFSSPTLLQVYKLNYSINKKRQGLQSEMREDDGSILTKKMRRELRTTNPDSFDMDLDDFDELEIEMLKYTSANDESPAKGLGVDMKVPEEYRPELKQLTLGIRVSSIIINDEYTYELPSVIRSSNIINGSKLSEDAFDEDSLLVALKSGLLILIRFFEDDDRITPYIVQWWKTSSSPSQPTSHARISDVGNSILTHASGSAVAVTALEGTIRLYQCTQTPHGIMLDKIQNIVFDGTILHTCFLDPLKDADPDHILLFAIMITSHRRYLVRIFECWLDECNISERSPLYLTNDFDLPVFIIPFKQGVLLVMEKRLLFMSANQLLSADLNFISTSFDVGFPISYYKPQSAIISDKIDDEVLISTEDGVIYSVTIDGRSIKFQPILKVFKISNFILEKIDIEFDLLYTSEFTNSGHIVFSHLLSPAEFTAVSKIKFSKGISKSKIPNWSPLFDVEVVDTRKKAQELWMANGKKLSNLKYGLRATKDICDSKLRKAYKVFSHVTVDDDIYFIFSYVDKTLLFKYEDDVLMDVEESGLDLLNRTIAISSIEDICLQVSARFIIVSDFATNQVIQKEIYDVVYADILSNFIVVLSESDNPQKCDGSVNTLTVFEVSGGIKEFGKPLILNNSPNFAKFVVHKQSLFLVIGFSKMLQIFEKQSGFFVKLFELNENVEEPHDLVFNDNKMFISSRFGEISLFSLELMDKAFQIQYLYSLRITETPIDMQMCGNNILLISKSSWILNLNAKYPCPVVFDEQRERTIFSAIKLDDERFAFLRDDGFCISTISNQMGPIVKSIKLGNHIPKKIKYISHLGVFAIITEDSLMFANKYNKLETRLYSRKPSEGLFEEDVPLSLSEWVFRTSVRSFRNLLIGCKTRDGGAIKILQPKFSSEGTHIVEALEIFSTHTDGAVLAFEQLLDDTVIYSSGTSLLISTYSMEKKKMSEPKLVKEFGSLIINIDVKGQYVLISTKDYSTSFMRYFEGDFKELNDDTTSRSITNSICFDSNTAITTDKLHCTIVGLKSHKYQFKCYTDFVPRLKRCLFTPLWFERTNMKRFLAYGIGGDLELFTFIDAIEAEDIKTLFENKSNTTAVHKKVTDKGFWDLNDPSFRTDSDFNVFTASKTKDKCPENIEILLNSIFF